MKNSYHAGIAKLNISIYILKLVRKNMYKLFLKHFPLNENNLIVDFGSSEQETEDSNYFIKCYPFKNKITCLSIFDNRSLGKRFPDITVLSIKKDKPLKFSDNHFDILICNAVLEHFSSEKILIQNIKEMSRISKKFYITLPNCLFPIEHHTSLPLLHYLSKDFFRKIIHLLGFNFYSHKENLNFYSKRKIHKIFKNNIHDKVIIKYTGILLGILSSNIAIIKNS